VQSLPLLFGRRGFEVEVLVQLVSDRVQAGPVAYSAIAIARASSRITRETMTPRHGPTSG